MFCDKCGKDNAENAVKCKSCGAPMPAKAFKGGFGDILSYENSGAGTVKRESAPSSVQPVAPPPAPKGNNVVGIIAIVLSAIAIAVSVVSIVLSSGGNAKDEPKTEPETVVTTEAKGETVVPPTEPDDPEEVETDTKIEDEQEEIIEELEEIEELDGTPQTTPGSTPGKTPGSKPSGGTEETPPVTPPVAPVISADGDLVNGPDL